MRHYRSYSFAGILALAVAACAYVSTAVMRGVSLAFDFIMSAVPATTPRLATDGPTLTRSETGSDIDAALYQGNRHESGVPKRAADRHI